MLARLAFAGMAALGGAAWLHRALTPGGHAAAPEGEPDNSGSERAAGPRGMNGRCAWLRAIVLGWCGAWAAIWLAIALLRLRYPFELEWAGGSMRDHCERVLAGLPLYTAPGPDWFSFEYPPLYFWTSALVMRVLHDGSFMSMRLVSIVCTLGCAWLLAAWVRAVAPGPAGRTWGFIAAGVFLATYRFTGAWYDIERLDMLFLFLSLLGGYWLLRATASATRPAGARAGGAVYLRLALAAIAFWLAFLTKQQAALFLIGGAAALALCRQWRGMLVFGGTGSALCLGSLWILDWSTRGWFSYYCFRVPAANGIRMNLAAQFFVTDLPLFAPFLALIAVLVLGAWRRAASTPRVPDGLITDTKADAPTGRLDRAPITATWCLMGLLGSLLSRAHWGGDQNVLMAGFIGLTLLACILAAGAETRRQSAAVPLYAVALAQMLTLVYRPDAQLPTASGRAAAVRYAAAVRAAEREGEVLCLDHGGVSAVRHFHLMGMIDVIGTEKRMPARFVDALRSHRYAAIFSDAKPEAGGAFAELSRDYRSVTCLHIGSPWVATGFPTPAPDRMVWVLKP